MISFYACCTLLFSIISPMWVKQNCIIQIQTSKISSFSSPHQTKLAVKKPTLRPKFNFIFNQYSNLILKTIKANHQSQQLKSETWLFHFWRAHGFNFLYRLSIFIFENKSICNHNLDNIYQNLSLTFNLNFRVNLMLQYLTYISVTKFTMWSNLLSFVIW